MRAPFSRLRRPGRAAAAPLPWEAGPGGLRGAAPGARSGSADRAVTRGLRGRRKEEAAPAGIGFSLEGEALLGFQGFLASTDGMLLL